MKGKDHEGRGKRQCCDYRGREEGDDWATDGAEEGEARSKRDGGGERTVSTLRAPSLVRRLFTGKERKVESNCGGGRGHTQVFPSLSFYTTL